MKTVFITGSSSGIGKSTAKLFQSKGWNVIATMRSPQNETELQKLPNVIVEKLDVTNKSDIKTAIKNGIKRFGKIDVIVNNAGYGLTGIFETATEEEILRQFNTNVFGIFNVIRAILPHFRENRDGTIINVTSMGGKLTVPFYSLYHSTKFAVEGFSDSLQFELKPFNIRVKLIEPGPIKTDFYGRSMNTTNKTIIPDYAKLIENGMPKMEDSGISGASPEVVAKTIWRAANDKSYRMRYISDNIARILLFLRFILPDRIYHLLIRTFVMR